MYSWVVIQKNNTSSDEAYNYFSIAANLANFNTAKILKNHKGLKFF